jgi:glycosyltransferase involved in cell wall biosynthesis
MTRPGVAFYAPMKPPGHPVPSGDRALARLFPKLLEQGGFAPFLASTFRSHQPGGDDATVLAEAPAAVEQALALCRSERPALWLTYHCYYKAPDLLGSVVSQALGIPYVVAEGSRAPARKARLWPESFAAAERALDQADLVLMLNPRDRELMERARPPHQALVDWPPVIDEALWPALARRRTDGPFAILAVAMMREGDKLASYGLLSEALAHLGKTDWRLEIVGEGVARREVQALFARFGDRVRWHGLVEDRAELAGLYADADCLAWPAVNEAFGMVFLEAALQGCPAVAGAHGGVAGIVRAGETGLLAPPGDAAAFAERLRSLVLDRALASRLGAAARRRALAEHGVEAGAARLRLALAKLSLAVPAP